MEQLLLLQGVREVSVLADADEPTTVTQRAFDAAAARYAGNGGPALPDAKRIAEQLRREWREVLTIAHEPEEKHSHLLGARDREEPAQEWLTNEYVAHVVRRVANRLGKATLTRGEYRAERDAMLAEDARRWSHERPLLVPSVDAIVTTTGDWDAALQLAGLVVGARPAQVLGVSRLDVMDLFYDEHGEQPSWRALHDYARAANVCLGSGNGQKWSDTIRLWRERRSERGLPEPRVVARRGGRSPRANPDERKRPDYSANAAAATPAAPGGVPVHPHRRSWARRADCVAWVARYIMGVAPGERSTKRGYAAWARSRDGAPSASRFDRHGGWESVRRDALKQLASGAPAD